MSRLSTRMRTKPALDDMTPPPEVLTRDYYRSDGPGKSRNWGIGWCAKFKVQRPKSKVQSSSKILRPMSGHRTLEFLGRLRTVDPGCYRGWAGGDDFLKKRARMARPRIVIRLKARTAPRPTRAPRPRAESTFSFLTRAAITKAIIKTPARRGKSNARTNNSAKSVRRLAF